jgi:hypothetical protein
VKSSAPLKAALEVEASSLNPADRASLFVPARFRLRAADNRPIPAWRVEVLDAGGGLYCVLKAEPEKGGLLDWDGSDGAGQAFVSGQVYQFRLILTDVSGEEAAMPEVLRLKAVFRQ